MSFFSGLLGDRGNGEFSLIIDVGSESIGAAFVQIKKDSSPFVLGVARHVIPFQEKINMERFVILLQETLQNVLNDEKIKAIKEKPNSVIFTLASPWYKSQTRVVHIEEDEEFIITDNGLKTILEKEKNTFLNKNVLANKKNKLLEDALIESYITQIKIDGYEIPNPVGRKTKNIDISIHIATSPVTITSSLSEIINKNWPEAKTIFHSFMFSAFNAVRDIFGEAASYILIDVAGEITDISLIRDNVIIESISFPLGNRSFLRLAMRQLSLQGELATTEVELYLKNALSAERTIALDDVFSKTTHDWSLLFVASIKQLSLKYPIPKNIYLLTNEEYLNFFEKSIKYSSADVFGENQEDFKITSLDSKSLSESTLSNDSGCKDLFLCVTIILLSKLFSAENKHNKQ